MTIACKRRDVVVSHTSMNRSWRSMSLSIPYLLMRSQHTARIMDRSYAVSRNPPKARNWESMLLSTPQDAIAALNTLQSNSSVIDAIRKSRKGMNKDAIPEMIDWCRKIGYEVCANRGDLYTIAFTERCAAVGFQSFEFNPHCRYQR